MFPSVVSVPPATLAISVAMATCALKQPAAGPRSAHCSTAWGLCDWAEDDVSRAAMSVLLPEDLKCGRKRRRAWHIGDIQLILVESRKE